MTTARAIRGVVFDKDGTLFDFNATWGAWNREMLMRETGGDPAQMARLAEVMGYDLGHNRFRPGAIVIAETVEVVAAAMMPVLGETDRDALVARMNAATEGVPQVPAAPLADLMAALRHRGIRTGVATNDAEAPARRHLTRAGIAEMFDFIAGYDSGFGGKPATGQLDAFCAQTGLAPRDCVMVGDSLHDLAAGRAAGMRCVGVLTGPAPADELAPLADVVLPTVADLPHWIDSQN